MAQVSRRMTADAQKATRISVGIAKVWVETRWRYRCDAPHQALVPAEYRDGLHVNRQVASREQARLSACTNDKEMT